MLKNDIYTFDSDLMKLLYKYFKTFKFLRKRRSKNENYFKRPVSNFNTNWHLNFFIRFLCLKRLKNSPVII